MRYDACMCWHVTACAAALLGWVVLVLFVLVWYAPHKLRVDAHACPQPPHVAGAPEAAGRAQPAQHTQVHGAVCAVIQLSCVRCGHVCGVFTVLIPCICCAHVRGVSTILFPCVRCAHVRGVLTILLSRIRSARNPWPLALRSLPCSETSRGSERACGSETSRGSERACGSETSRGSERACVWTRRSCSC